MADFMRTVCRTARLSCLAALILCAPSSSANASGPLVNDVGQGALVWGTSSERTTYLGPYNSLMAPKIRRIPEDNLNAVVRPNYEDKTSLWKTTNEVGTVIGTDGKVYRYHYDRGVEPTVVRELRVVDGREQYVERVVMKPILIRVLEPMDAVLAKSKEQQRAQNADPAVAPCQPAAALPQPCDPVGKGDAANPKNPADPASVQPKLGDAGNGEIFDPTMNRAPVGPDPNEKVDAFVTITIPDVSRAPVRSR